MDMDPDSPLAEDLLRSTARMQRLARAVLGHDQDAEDAAQDAWCRTLGSTSNVPRHVPAWLAGVARNVARERRRASRRRRKREEAVARPDECAPAQDAVDRLDAMSVLLRVVRALPAPYRAALTLRYVVGLSPADAADALGLKSSTLRSHVHRGLALVRDELDRRRRGDHQSWKAVIAPLLSSPLPAVAGVTIVNKSMWILGVALLALLVAAGAHFTMNGTGAPHEMPQPEGLTSRAPSQAPSLEGITTAAHAVVARTGTLQPGRNETKQGHLPRYAVRVSVRPLGRIEDHDLEAAWLYAIPASRQQRAENDSRDGIRIRWRGDLAPVTLELPAAGQWHIGLNTRMGVVRSSAVDVTPEHIADVTLEIPDPTIHGGAPITVFVDHKGSPGEVEGIDAVVEVAPLSTPGRRYSQHPGPGETARPRRRYLPAKWGERIVVPCYDPDASYAVSVSLRSRKTRRTSGWLVGPEMVTCRAGGEARFVAQQAGTLLVNIKWPADSGETPRAPLRVALTPADGRAIARMEREPRGDSIKAPAANMAFIATPGVWDLQWSGHGWEEGRTSGILVRPGPTAVIPLAPVRAPFTASEPAAVQKDAQGELKPSRSELLRARYPVRLTGLSGLGTADSDFGHFFQLYGVAKTRDGLSHTIQLEGAHQHRDGPVSVDELHSRSGLVSDWAELQAIAAIRLPWQVARLDRPVTPNRRESLAFTTGGFLIAVPSRYPQGTSLRLRARDGGVLTTVQPQSWREGLSDVRDAGITVATAPGTMIGPLPAGTYEFDVLLGGAAVAKVSGTVEASRIVPLTIDIGATTPR